jgi:hypothetical protein
MGVVGSGRRADTPVRGYMHGQQLDRAWLTGGSDMSVTILLRSLFRNGIGPWRHVQIAGQQRSG